MPVKVVLLLWCAAAYPETRAPRARSARRAARRVCGGGREPWTAAGWARERASALADGVGGERAFPVFLKFHKVGSATVSRAIRCAALSHPALVADAWDRDATARVANASAAFSCGPMPYEHHTLALYARHGLDALRACTRAEQRGRFAPRLLTVLRDPFERLLSAVYFFARGGAAGGGVAPRARAPFGLAEFARVRERVLAQAGGLREYADGLARGDVAGAKRALSRDFAVVGVTEDMAGFLALVALEMRWPTLLMCYFDYHRNDERPRREQFAPAVVAALEAELAGEREVYEHARSVFERHAARRGAAFASARAELVGALQGGGCREAKRRQHCAVSRLPEATAPLLEKRNCFSVDGDGKSPGTIGGTRDREPPR